MRVEILSNDRASFIKPMSEGLCRMLRDCGADARLHYDGLMHLMLRQRPDISSVRSLAGSALRLNTSRRGFAAFLERLEGADVIVVVANVPGSFSRGLMPNVELLRVRFPHVPIVNYDLHYLPTLDSWSRFLLKGEPTQLPPADLKLFEKGRFGLERYDWYLMASVGTEVPLPPGDHPYSLIGLDLDDGTLYPDQRGRFRALLDFEQSRGAYPAFRKVQLDALRMAGVEYEALEGNYAIEKIRAIYRRTSIYFLASSEAFGLPICEVQACGALVFTPDAYWPASHWLGDDYHVPREPRLSPNFVVYENDPEKLAEAIRGAAARSDPSSVRATFEKHQPWLLFGDRTAVQNFLDRLSTGEIHSQLHREHRGIGRPAAEPL
ncbi:MAG TPA: hypothetical protein VHM24_09325 [Gemmatimonadaceae bacterium]|nr:hypothetical protein [Gemmatimonadaceae bacterium]